MIRHVVIAVALAAAATAGAQGSKPDTAQKLPGATIKGTQENLPEVFMRRSRMKGTGKFLTAKDIERIDPPHTPNLLARVSGGDIRDISGGTSVIVGPRGTRMSMIGSVPNQLCVIGLAINDTRVPAGYDLKAIRPEDIAAIEYYGGPSSIPLELSAQMQTDADCGLFVIWLKERKRKP